MEKLSLKTSKRFELLDITERIKIIVAASQIKEGTCFIFCPHTTAGLTINENADPSVRKDIVSLLSKLIPRDYPYEHAEGNSDSHIMSSLLGASLNIFVAGGELALGTWQGIYFCESDGPRSREVWVKIVHG